MDPASFNLIFKLWSGLPPKGLDSTLAFIKKEITRNANINSERYLKLEPVIEEHYDFRSWMIEYYFCLDPRNSYPDFEKAISFAKKNKEPFKLPKLPSCGPRGNKKERITRKAAVIEKTGTAFDCLILECSFKLRHLNFEDLNILVSEKIKKVIRKRYPVDDVMAGSQNVIHSYIFYRPERNPEVAKKFLENMKFLKNSCKKI